MNSEKKLEAVRQACPLDPVHFQPILWLLHGGDAQRLPFGREKPYQFPLE